jgi:uncharacterized phosphosugar-binding protein
VPLSNEDGGRGECRVADQRLLRVLVRRAESQGWVCDIVDDVIDNHCPVGDDAISAGTGDRMAATSTISFALLAQLLSIGIAEELSRQGQPPAVILSANVDAAPR